jgi:hypothetical protein
VPGSNDSPESADFGLAGDRGRLREAEQITLWAATGINEQLFIAHVLHRAEEMDIDAARVHLVQFETRRGLPARILGTGELNEQEDFGEAHPNASGWLGRAMSLLLNRFPEKRSGLSWWDFALLTEVRARGPNAARVVGYTIVNYWDDGDQAHDFYLFGRLLHLGDPQLPAPLLDISGDRRNMRDVHVALTPFGLDVLEGRASSYPINPIDDWASGVKLSSAQGMLWFNEGGRLVRAARG